MNGISQSYFHNSITPLFFVDDKYIRTACYMKKFNVKHLPLLVAKTTA